MQIYIVIKDIRYDQMADVKIEAFYNLEDAKKYFKETSQAYRQDALEDEWKIDCDTDDCFETYVEGEESHYHYYIYILTKEVR